MADVHDRIREWWDRDAGTYDPSASRATTDPAEAAAWRAAVQQLLPGSTATCLGLAAGLARGGAGGPGGPVRRGMGRLGLGRPRQGSGHRTRPPPVRDAAGPPRAVRPPDPVLAAARPVGLAETGHRGRGRGGVACRPPVPAARRGVGTSGRLTAGPGMAGARAPLR